MFRKLIFIALMSALSFEARAKTSTASREMKKVLNAQQSLKPKPIEKLSVQEARLQPTVADGAQLVLARKGRVPDMTGLEKVYDLEIEGAAGKLPARVYKPAGENLPVTLYFHGGGWVIADLDVYDASAYALAKKSGTIVVAVEYRRAPENPFPAAHEDAFAAYRWLLSNAGSLSGDPGRIAVAGESAGGNLAANVSIRARDENLQMPAHQVLIYPVAGNDLSTLSYRENAKAKPLNKPMMEWFFTQYLGSVENTKDPRINLVAADLHGLPATTLITADIDPLRSEGLKLGDRLRAQGVQVHSRNYTGVTHEFFGLADVVSQARAAQDFAAAELRVRSPKEMNKITTR